MLSTALVWFVELVIWNDNLSLVNLWKLAGRGHSGMIATSNILGRYNIHSGRVRVKTQRRTTAQRTAENAKTDTTGPRWL